jgi:hypothetical protein
MMLKMPHKDWRKLGTRTIEVMLYGSGGYKMKNIHRVVKSKEKGIKYPWVVYYGVK